MGVATTANNHEHQANCEGKTKKRRVKRTKSECPDNKRNKSTWEHLEDLDCEDKIKEPGKIRNEIEPNTLEEGLHEFKMRGIDDVLWDDHRKTGKINIGDDVHIFGSS